MDVLLESVRGLLQPPGADKMVPDGADAQKLYMELTTAMMCAMLTCLAVYKLMPYLTSAIVFFFKFCVCMMVFALCMQFIQNSELVKALSPAYKWLLLRFV